MSSTTSRAINGNLIQVSHSRVCKRFVTNYSDVLTALTEKKGNIIDELTTQLNIMNGLKWYVAVRVKFTKTVNNEEVVSTPTFHGKTRALLPADDMEEQFIEALDKILESMAKWICEGSGWTLEYVEQIDLFITKYQPLYASSYIPTPKKIAHPTKGIVNIKNEDNKCFLWSVLYALHKHEDHHNYRVNNLRRYQFDLNMNGINFPVKLPDIDKFEKLNSTISINIFGFENDEVYPLRITRERGRIHRINLLLLSNPHGNTHYCVINDLSRLLSHLTKNNRASYYCNYCLHRFSREDLLLDHEPLCKPHGIQKTKLPTEENKWIYFKNYTLTHKVPYTIYCDFESYVVPIDTALNDPTTSHSTKTAHHIPSGFCYVIVDSEGKAVKPPEVYTGPNVIDTLLGKLMDEASNIVPVLRTNRPMVMTNANTRDFDTATNCHLCHKPLNNDKVRNHNHLTGQYLGASHYACNLNYQVPQHIPVFFHNLQGYDCHHLMQGFGKFKKERMSCIAKTSERYISVTLESLRFLDSLQFMNASLETLVNNLATEGSSKFNILRQCMGEAHLDLLLRKGVFPYTWLTDESKLAELQLPPKDAFFNDLTQTGVADEDYNHAQTVWSVFNMASMKDYHNLYLKTDVLLLADVFENFRNTSIQYYEIDPCNVYSAPGLAWNSMLKMTDVKLELLTDIDKHLFIEAGVRGGVAMIPHRYAKANNPQLPDYDSTKPTTYLMYLDCNNLYGTAMSQPLPQSDFKWLSSEEIDSLNISGVPDESKTGYIMEVDLHYPVHLHDLHSDYPLAPERRPITEDMLSPYSKQLLAEFNFKPSKEQKLLTTLTDKKNYVLHYRNLKLYLNMGLQLKKIHRVLSFTQCAWLAPFIQFNTEKRTVSKNIFEKDFFKLMNNATYGKSLENVRSYIDFKLVTTEEKLVKWTANPRLKSFFAFNKDLAGLTLKKKSILLNKPVYVGLTVLDISKLIMFEFHYGWAVQKYGPNIKLCMTDTDSLFYHVTTPDIYQDMKNDIHLFDTSDYPQDHPNYSAVNKKKLGKFKDEFNGKPPMEIVGLRAKCYSVLDCDRVEKKVAKGVPRVAIKRQLKHDTYKQCLFDHRLKTTSSYTINSDRHQIFTQHMTKLSLSPYDDKRYILEDGIRTLAFGHYKIEHDREEDDYQPPAKKGRLVHPSTSNNTDLTILAALLDEDSTSEN